ncbi:hypothetical protein TNCV_3027151 [Trichonephila clavipes]|nr:hypothetical protein TNCV_3027151 [Trichonephila clavipes]
MTSQNHFDDSMTWRAVGSHEAGESQEEMGRSLQVARKWSPGCGINSKQVVLLTERDGSLRPALSLVCPFDCILQERQDICGAENINRGPHKNGGVFVLFNDEWKSPQTKGFSSSFHLENECGAHFHSSYVTKIERFRGKGILVYGGI